MSKTSNLETYRVIWLFGSVLVVASFFLSYVYDRTLIETMQNNMPEMFNFMNDPSMENITIAIIDIGFILLILGTTLCVIYSLVVSEKSGIWTAPGGIRLWNASTLELTAIVLFSSPIFLYKDGKLVQILSFLGTEYSPKFDGFGIGYYLMVAGVIMSIIAGRQVMRARPKETVR